MKHEFGIKNGKLIHISELEAELERGKKCNCICPYCKRKLIANMGKVKRHYFSHYQLECDPYKAYESALHLLAKEILLEHRRIRVPSVYLVYLISYYLNGVRDGYITVEKASDIKNIIERDKIDQEDEDDIVLKAINEQNIELQEVTPETRIGDFVPDILAKGANGVYLAIEIAVTHFIDEEKEQKIKKAELATIEIDLSHLFKKDYEEFDRDKLVHEIIECTENKEWIYSKVIEKKRKALQEEIHTLLEKEFLEEKERVEKQKARERSIIKKVEERQSMTPLQYKQILDKYKKELKNDTRIRQWLSDLEVTINKNYKLNCCNIYIEGELIFLCDRRIWQTAIFHRFIRKNSMFCVANIVDWILKESDLEVEKDLAGWCGIRIASIPTLEEVLRAYLYYLYQFNIVQPLFLKYKRKYNRPIAIPQDIHRYRKFKVNKEALEHIKFKVEYPCEVCGELVQKWEFMTSTDACLCTECYKRLLDERELEHH